MNIEEIKMDHFENFEELIKTCKMWIRDDDIDAYYRFFEFNCMKALVTAYEKEKEKNKKLLSDNIESFQKYFSEEFNKRFISIDKLKEIVDECIPKKENIITRELEYTPNTNANSYLTQEILSLLKEE